MYYYFYAWLCCGLAVHLRFVDVVHYCLRSTEYCIVVWGVAKVSIDKSGMPLQMYEVLQSQSKGTQLGTIGFISGEARGRREKYAQVYTPYICNIGVLKYREFKHDRKDERPDFRDRQCPLYATRSSVTWPSILRT